LELFLNFYNFYFFPFQIPCQVFDKQRFESISSAIIPSEEVNSLLLKFLINLFKMRDRMITVNMFENKIIGYPIGMSKNIFYKFFEKENLFH